MQRLYADQLHLVFHPIHPQSQHWIDVILIGSERATFPVDNNMRNGLPSYLEEVEIEFLQPPQKHSCQLESYNFQCPRKMQRCWCCCLHFSKMPGGMIWSAAALVLMVVVTVVVVVVLVVTLVALVMLMTRMAVVAVMKRVGERGEYCPPVAAAVVVRGGENDIDCPWHNNLLDNIDRLLV